MAIFQGIALFIVMSLVSEVQASDIVVWQGQYFTGTTFNVGTYEFNFMVYDAQAGGGDVLLQHY
ncbi:MAG: hypothetical protein AABX70_02680 [Nanoarchaeota archaeon]